MTPSGRTAVAAVVASLLASTVRAQEPAAGTELGVVEVVGRRTPATLDVTTDSITAADISAQHRDDLAQALETAPGVVLQNLGQRRERLILLRGFTSRQVPLFIDGIPVYVPYDGNVDLARFGVDYVSEIVVSKGLASLLYGPNILGGAVNVVSRRPQAPIETSARVGVELDDRWDGQLKRAAFSIGGRGDRWYASLNASGVDANGYRLPSSFAPVAAEDGGRRENAESEDTLVVARVGFTPNATDEYAIAYYRQDGSKQDPPYAGSYLRTNARLDGVQTRFWRWPSWDKESLSVHARLATGNDGTLRVRAYRDEFRNSLDSYDDATYRTQTRPFAFAGSNYDDYSVGAGADYEWAWNDAQVTRASAHYKRDVHREEQRAPVVPEQRLDIPTWDIGIEHEWRVAPNFVLTPSYQHVVQPGRTVQVYGTGRYVPVTVDQSIANNGQLVATWQLGASDTFTGGVSRKTRLPTLRERFSGGFGSIVPNAALSPESATHYEIGYERKSDVWRAKVALFRSNVRDAVESVTLPSAACSSPPCSQLRNVGRQRNQGIELSGVLSPVDTLQLSATIDLLDRDNLSSPSIAVTNTPKHRYRVAVNWDFADAWRLNADAQYEGARVSNTTATRRAGAYGTANAFVRFSPSDEWGLEAGARNIGDRLYAYEEGYFEAGRTFLFQVDWRR